MTLIVVAAVAGGLLLLDGGTTIVPGKQRLHLRSASLLRFTQSRLELRVMAAFELTLGTFLLVLIGAAVSGGWFVWLAAGYPVIITGVLGGLILAVRQRR